MITKFDRYNESVRDMMKPKSEEDIRKSSKDITDPKEMMILGIQHGQPWMVKDAIDKGVQVGGYIKLHDSYLRKCHSYLEYATSAGNVEIVKLLMDNGAEGWGKDVEDAIRLAQSEWKIDILKILSPYKDWDEIKRKHDSWERF